MDEKTWTIVQFVEDESVEAIPTSWIQGEQCYWPPYRRDKLTMAIKKCESLSLSWPRHTIKIFRNATFDEYAKARLKSKAAENCSGSDLPSEKELDGKRRRIQKVLSSSSEKSSDDDSYKLPIKPPKLPKLNIIKNQPGDNLGFNNNNSEMDNDCYLNEITNNTNDHEKIEDGENNASQDIQLVNQPQNGSHQCCFQQEHGVLMQLKKQNYIIRGILVDVLQEIKELKKRGTNDGESTIKSIFIKYQNIKFPIMTVEDFEKFEEELIKEENNFNEAVKELSKFGGSSPYDFIKRTLSAIISDDILMKFSWLGRKGKQILSNTNIAKVLIAAANKAGFDNQKLVEGAVQSFIKRCPERKKAKENKKT